MATAVKPRKGRTPAAAPEPAPAVPTLVDADGEQLEIAIPAAAGRLQVRYVAHDHVHPDPAQPRTDADAELRASIAAHGVLQPLTVRAIPPDTVFTTEACAHCGRRWADLWTDGAGGGTHYLLVDGERRWRGAEGVQATLPVLVRDDQADDVARLVTQLVANTGKPLSPLQEARAYARILERDGGTVADLARRLGKPRTTIGERLPLLQLGPWGALLEDGTIPVSYAVRYLLKYAGAPDAAHAEALGRARKDYRWENATRGNDGKLTGKLSLGGRDFERCVDVAYGPLAYPLTKRKDGYGVKNPTFDTRPHDAECECGGAEIAIGYDGPRKVCLNPAWWRPRHRKGLAAKKTAESKASPATGGGSAPKGGLTLYLPKEAGAASVGYGDAPKGTTTLMGNAGRWKLREDSNTDTAFDPADLVIDPAKLVLVRKSYGDPIVVTKDAAAVKAARTKWAARWRARYAEVLAARAPQLDAGPENPELCCLPPVCAPLERSPLAVPLCRALLGALVADTPDSDSAGWWAEVLVETALARSLPVPDDVRATCGWAPESKAAAQLLPRVRAWLAAELDPLAVYALVTAVGVAQTRGLVHVRGQVEDEMDKTIAAIERRDSPWTKPPKAEPPKNGRKAAGGRAAAQARAAKRGAVPVPAGVQAAFTAAEDLMAAADADDLLNDHEANAAGDVDVEPGSPDDMGFDAPDDEHLDEDDESGFGADDEAEIDEDLDGEGDDDV